MTAISHTGNRRREGGQPRFVGINHTALEVGDIEQAIEIDPQIFDFTLRAKRPGMLLSSSAANSSI